MSFGGGVGGRYLLPLWKRDLAPLYNAKRVRNRLRFPCEEFLHLLRGLEVAFPVEGAFRMDFREGDSVRDTPQNIVRFRVFGFREVNVVRGDDGDMKVGSQLREIATDSMALRGVVVLKFEVEGVGKVAAQDERELLRLSVTAVMNKPP